MDNTNQTKEYLVLPFVETEQMVVKQLKKQYLKFKDTIEVEANLLENNIKDGPLLNKIQDDRMRQIKYMVDAQTQ